LGLLIFSKDTPVISSYILIYAAKHYCRVEIITSSVYTTKQSEFHPRTAMYVKTIQNTEVQRSNARCHWNP